MNIDICKNCEKADIAYKNLYFNRNIYPMRICGKCNGKVITINHILMQIDKLKHPNHYNVDENDYRNYINSIEVNKDCPYYTEHQLNDWYCKK